MKAPIYDYTRQRWTEIDTDTDTLIDAGGSIETRETPDGTRYMWRKTDGAYRWRNPITEKRG